MHALAIAVFVLAGASCSAAQPVAVTPVAVTPVALTPVAMTPATGAPRFVRAHFDRVEPKDAHDFAAARASWLTWLRGAHASDGWWGTYVEVEGAGFLSLRTFDSFAELDRAKDSPPQPAGYDEAVKRYNEGSDSVLVFPHVSQIWAIDADLSYQPAHALGLDGDGAGTITFASVKPTGAQAYAEAWAEIDAGLAKVGYPLAKWTYWSVYGDGRIVTIWMAPSAQELAAAPTIEAALAAALGPDRAATLLQAARASEIALETYPVRLRPDLSSAK